MMLASLVTFLQILELVGVAAAPLVEEPLAPLRLHVEVEHGLGGATPSDIFGKFAHIFCSIRHTNSKNCGKEKKRKWKMSFHFSIVFCHNTVAKSLTTKKTILNDFLFSTF